MIVRLEEYPFLGSLSRWWGPFLLLIVVAVVGIVPDIIAVLVCLLKRCRLVLQVLRVCLLGAFVG